MNRLLIVGAGGHGRVIADAALTSGAWDLVCFVDDGPVAARPLGFEVVGTSRDLERLVDTCRAAAVGIGDARTRLRLLERCQQAGFELPPIVHRTAAISAFASLGSGVVVFAQAAINPGAVISHGCIINTGATVDHDCEIGEGAHICPGVNLAGNVRVGARAWIGIGSSVKQGVTIGADVVVGAGAAVVSDVEDGLVVAGVPARPLRKKS